MKLIMDCHIPKIQCKYEPHMVVMEKDGTLIEHRTEWIQPNLFGWKRKNIIDSYFDASKRKYVPVFFYTNLCANQEAAMREANTERIKTLLDDRWFVVEESCRAKNKLNVDYDKMRTGQW